MVESFSPKDIVTRLTTLFDFACSRLAKASARYSWLNLVFVASLSILFVALLPKKLNTWQTWVNIPASRILDHYIILSLAWIWVGLALYVRPPKPRDLLLTLSGLSIILTFFVEISFSKAYEIRVPLLFTAYELLFPLILCPLYLWTRDRSIRFCLTAVGLTFVALALLSFPLSFYVEKRPWWITVRSPRWFMIVWMLLLEYKGKLHQQNRFETWTYFLSPINLVFPVPVRTHDWCLGADRETRIRGLFNITMGLLAGCAAAAMYKSNLDFTTPLASFSVGLRYYLFLFTFSYFSLGTAVGWMQWLGFRLPDAFHFPLLSSSPQDRWRNWNTYFYHFYYAAVFLPIFRRTKSLWLGIFFTFLVTAGFHLGSAWSHIFAFDARVLFSHRMAYTLLFFLLHGVAVFIGIRLQNVWPKAGSRQAWLGVLATWIMMLFIHFTRRWDL